MLFKKYEAVWLQVALALLAAAVLLPVLFGAEILPWIMISAGSGAALFAVYCIPDIRNWNGILSGRSYSCDLYAFMDEIQELANGRYVFLRTKIRLQFIIVDALLDIGKLEQAFMVLQVIDIKKATRIFSLALFEYLCSSVKYHLYTGDKNTCETELILLGMETDKFKNYKRKYDGLRATYTDLQNRLFFLKNEYQACREYFSEIFDASLKTPYEKCFAAYYLGFICLKKKETERAKECFTYIVENGNTLFFVENAAEQLELLSRKAAQA